VANIEKNRRNKMNSNDLHHNIKQSLAIIPAAIGTNATKAGPIIDRQGYGGVEFLIDYGSVTTTGTIVTALLKEGDVTGTLTSVADDDMLGTEALASLLAGARAAGTGKGNKRYVQLSLVQTGTTSVGAVAATAILHNPEVAPISNP
jgi:hypothetical protein